MTKQKSSYPRLTTRKKSMHSPSKRRLPFNSKSKSDLMKFPLSNQKKPTDRKRKANLKQENLILHISNIFLSISVCFQMTAVECVAKTTTTSYK